jgi:WD40 repeat protein
VDAVSLSVDGRYAISGSRDNTIKLWALDWELQEKEPTDWDELARPYLETFLTLHTPYAAELPQGRDPTEEEVRLALTRGGIPVWTVDDFQQLLYKLGCAGYGWLRPEGVRRKLEELAAQRT